MAQAHRRSDEEGWQDEKDTLLSDTESISPPSSIPSFSAWTYILAAVLATNVLSIVLTYSFTKTATINAYSEDFEGTQKVYPNLDRSLSWVNFSNHRVNFTSRWSAEPSPEVDHAWNELGVKEQVFLLPEQLGREVYGLDPRVHVFAPDGTLGQGVEGGFGVFVQGLHDMHCLNELRRALYFNKEYYRQFEDDKLTPEWARVSHVRHCLDNIRERIMCTSDTGVVPTIWTGPEENYPLFGREHKCHSYEALMDWFNRWHDSEKGRKIDWGVHLSAPKDAIFTDFDSLE